MAASNINDLSGEYKDTETVEPVTVSGTGAPANGDSIVTGTLQYPIGSTYIDTVAPHVYTRVAIAGVAADFLQVG
jgi:hypothetical protein